MNLPWSTRVCIVELSDLIWGSYHRLWDPGVFLIPIPFLFYWELELASHESAVQNSLHYIVFFSIHHFQRWLQMGLPTGNGVFRSSEQLDYVEDWMELRHGGWELEAVCVLANSLCHCEGSKIAMGKFL